MGNQYYFMIIENSYFINFLKTSHKNKAHEYKHKNNRILDSGDKDNFAMDNKLTNRT